MTQKTSRHAAATVRHWLTQTTEFHIIFPTITLIMLAIIWGITLNLIRLERNIAQQGAMRSSHQMAETYQAQVLRAFREIDQTLKIIQATSAVWDIQNVLPKLKTRGLLPPELVFTVSIADSRGNVVVSTGASRQLSVADRDYFQRQLKADIFAVGRSQPDRNSGVPDLHFSRRLEASDGQFAGIAVIGVDADYFVSSYDPSILGEKGLLGILDTDGEFLVKRSGETVSAGGRIDTTGLTIHREEEPVSETTLSVDTLDGVLRFISARQLYDFPLFIMVGLSENEQLASTRSVIPTYLWRAAAVSVLLILTALLLGYLRWQLVINRQKLLAAQFAQAEINEHLAYHDILTELPNRSLFSKLLGQGIHMAHRYNRQLAVLFLDLDRFKQINDTLGHEAGDELLKEVAVRLNGCLRTSDTVARLGGDEFVVLLPELDGGMYVAAVARKILTTVGEPFILAGQECQVTASVGISIYPQDGLDEQTLTKNADVAMYRAKETGRNQFKFYSRELNATS